MVLWESEQKKELIKEEIREKIRKKFENLWKIWNQWKL